MAGVHSRSRSFQRHSPLLNSLSCCSFDSRILGIAVAWCGSPSRVKLRRLVQACALSVLAACSSILRSLLFCVDRILRLLFGLRISRSASIESRISTVSCSYRYLSFADPSSRSVPSDFNPCSSLYSNCRRTSIMLISYDIHGCSRSKMIFLFRFFLLPHLLRLF